MAAIAQGFNGLSTGTSRAYLLRMDVIHGAARPQWHLLQVCHESTGSFTLSSAGSKAHGRLVAAPNMARVFPAAAILQGDTK
jgi:hypothetical protein